MIKFDIITIFPKIFDSYFSESIIKRAQKKKLINIKIHNLRDYTNGKHKSVDDKPYGGGPGMVMKIEPIYKAIQKIKNKKQKIKNTNKKLKIILFSAKGKKFTQDMAKRFSKLDRLIMICGRYEGIDERVAKYIADEEVSVGDYVLTGGEIPAMIVVDAVTRLIPGVIASESLKEESFASLKINYEYPQYTRPESFIIHGKKRTVPRVLLSGNHKKIEEWRKRILARAKSRA
jgi:tRNA (guanine37-N1)-methyltransferase